MLNVTPEGPRRDDAILSTLRSPSTHTVVPHGDIAVDHAPHGRRMLRLSTPVCFGLSIVVIGCGVVVESLGGGGSAWVPTFFLTGLVMLLVTSVIALCRAATGALELGHAAFVLGAAPIASAVLDLFGNLAMTAFGAWVTYLATFGFARGRQLRRHGKVLLPDLHSDAAWTTHPVVLGNGEQPPAGVAEQWRQNGKTEHASVAAFARLTLDLMALGAPPTLVAAANQDALDEIRHTELCFSLARALDGRDVSPGPFPQAQRVGTLPRSRTLALAKLAVDSLVDGALHEGVSARVIAKLAQRCQVPAIRAMLKEIAADEGRHAAHGWSVVNWCLDQGGAPVGRALLGAVRALPSQIQSQQPEAAREGGWEAWGIHGQRLEEEEYRQALAHLTERARAAAREVLPQVA